MLKMHTREKRIWES